MFINNFLRKKVSKMKDVAGAKDHLKNHIAYPASKEDLVKACNNLSDFSAEDKKWFMENLPDRTYNSSVEVEKALGWM